MPPYGAAAIVLAMAVAQPATLGCTHACEAFAGLRHRRSGIFIWNRLAFDIQNVFARMEAAQTEIRTELGNSPLGSLVLSHMGSNVIPVTQIVASIFSISTNVIAGVVVSVITGIYFAAHPAMYLNGFLIAVPSRPAARA